MNRKAWTFASLAGVLGTLSMMACAAPEEEEDESGGQAIEAAPSEPELQEHETHSIPVGGSLNLRFEYKLNGKDRPISLLFQGGPDIKAHVTSWHVPEATVHAVARPEHIALGDPVQSEDLKTQRELWLRFAGDVEGRVLIENTGPVAIHLTLDGYLLRSDFSGTVPGSSPARTQQNTPLTCISGTRCSKKCRTRTVSATCTMMPSPSRLFDVSDGLRGVGDCPAECPEDRQPPRCDGGVCL